MELHSVLSELSVASQVSAVEGGLLSRFHCYVVKLLYCSVDLAWFDGINHLD